MIDEAVTQEHERTVSAARSGMSWHDGLEPMKRWFYNYKDDKDALWWGGRWYIVTREGRRWKIESGPAEADKPTQTLWADPAAPAPPLMEFRPPKPEPVKPRYTSPQPFRVPSAIERIQRMLSPREYYEFMCRLRRRQRERRPIMPTCDYASFDKYDTISLVRDIELRYEELKPPTERDMMDLALDILNERLRFDYRPPAPMAMAPPPPPTRRNQ